MHSLCSVLINGTAIFRKRSLNAETHDRREDALPPHYWGVPSANEVPAWQYYTKIPHPVNRYCTFHHVIVKTTQLPTFCECNLYSISQLSRRSTATSKVRGGRCPVNTCRTHTQDQPFLCNQRYQPNPLSSNSPAKGWNREQPGSAM